MLASSVDRQKTGDKAIAVAAARQRTTPKNTNKSPNIFVKASRKGPNLGMTFEIRSKILNIRMMAHKVKLQIEKGRAFFLNNFRT